jgi:starch phosphorylase
MRLPFVGIGLFYPQGYFTQQIDAEGNQISTYSDNDPRYLPISPVKDEEGGEIYVEVKIAETQVFAKAWLVKVGHIRLYLLDTNVPQNNDNDRTITHKLYGGDEHTRIKQEIVLGIGGVRLLRKLGIAPTVWHINEGHAAFSILERLRELIQSDKSFEMALEAVAANTVFTTHTPVPAGHDHFSQELMMNYLGSFSIHDLRLSKEAFLALGHWPNSHSDFNMTSLAIHGSRHTNGVSRIHGQISAEICADFWPEISPPENPMGYVTNGVHVSSMLARQWNSLFDESLGVGWHDHLCDSKFWQRIEEDISGQYITDQNFWNVKQTVKSRMLTVVRDTLISQHLRHQISETHLEHLFKYIDPNNPNILTIGFARRFATYKRATLLLNDRDKLRTILNDSKRPVVFIFAGKAHPADVPGQDLLRELYRVSCEPEFIGKILVVQGYDLGLSRRLVSGVDVWLNNPVYPQEASGTSGMKVGINGGINLSVLDGWWPESYDGSNGWAIKPSPHTDNLALRDHEDARSLYEVLNDEVIPLYYDRGRYGYSSGWVKKAKRSMTTIMLQFNTVRMLKDYLKTLYMPASRQGRRLNSDNYAKAQELSNWKTDVKAKWEGVQVRLLSAPQTQQFSYGEPITIQVAVRLNNLQPTDVTVELLLSRQIYHPELLVPTQQDLQKLWQHNNVPTASYKFVPKHHLHDNGEYLYNLTLQPDWCGGLSYRIRVFPYHELLSDAHEMGMMRWV